jgi:hypothetical protein
MPSREPRLTLDELLLGAESNGCVLLLVEGERDREFFEWYLDGALEFVHVYTADDVEVPNELVFSLNLTKGSRARLSVLARVSPPYPNVRMIIDRDCGQDLPDPMPPTLMLTDYPAIESYGYGRRPLGKWLKLVAGESTLAVDTLLEELRNPLFFLYFLRTKVSNMPQPTYDKYYSKKSDFWSLDVKKLLVEHKVSKEDALVIETMVQVTPQEVRNHVYGHDLAGLLDVRLRTILRNKAQLRTVEAVERTLRLSIERSDIDDERLFLTLRQWAKPVPSIVGS